ncbi:MAG TPA: O-antigen ligase family protein [Bacteroidia bacterium]|nr:O-antigen ligase family protein [Bacteroidia bacterium]
MKGLYEEMFLGFWFLLILSDSLEPSMKFAQNTKNIYIVLLAGLFFLNQKDFRPINHLFQKFSPFFLIAVIALAYSETFLISLQKTISYFLIFMIAPNYMIKIYHDNGNSFLKKLVYFITAILIVGLILKVLMPEIAASHGGRFRGIFGNPNGLAIFCILSFLLTYLINHFRPLLFSRNEKIFIFSVVLLSLILTGSRSAAVALAIFLGFARFFKISPFFGFMVLIIAIVLYELIGANYVAIIRYLGLESFFRLETLEKGGGRYIAWAFAWEQIQHNFFLGKGIAFDEYFMRKNYNLLSRLGHEGGVHNSYLILWLNTGIIGLMLFLRSFFLSFSRANKTTKLAYPIMFAIMFTINFEPWIVSSLNPFTIIFLMIITLMSDKVFHEKEQENVEKLVENELLEDKEILLVDK